MVCLADFLSFLHILKIIYMTFCMVLRTYLSIAECVHSSPHHNIHPPSINSIYTEAALSWREAPFVHHVQLGE